MSSNPEPHRHGHHDDREHHQDPAPHIDPVCGMTVAADSPRRFEFDGTTYYFCSDHCLRKFSADPAKYVRAEPPAAAPAATQPQPAGTIYTCPMHPEIRQNGPGTCPK